MASVVGGASDVGGASVVGGASLVGGASVVGVRSGPDAGEVGPDVAGGRVVGAAATDAGGREVSAAGVVAVEMFDIAETTGAARVGVGVVCVVVGAGEEDAARAA